MTAWTAVKCQGNNFGVRVRLQYFNWCPPIVWYTLLITLNLVSIYYLRLMRYILFAALITFKTGTNAVQRRRIPQWRPRHTLSDHVCDTPSQSLHVTFISTHLHMIYSLQLLIQLPNAHFKHKLLSAQLRQSPAGHFLVHDAPDPVSVP